MRLILFVVLAITFLGTAKAQNISEVNNFGNQKSQYHVDSVNANKIFPEKKWFISKSMGFSSGMLFYNGGNASIFAAPISLQLNRRLSNNWYAFAGLAITPAYVNFNNNFIKAPINKFGQGFNNSPSNNFSINPRATMGLMYTNDQKTFSISGSISIEKSNYSYAPLNQFGTFSPGNFNSSNAFGRH